MGGHQQQSYSCNQTPSNHFADEEDLAVNLVEAAGLPSSSLKLLVGPSSGGSTPSAAGSTRLSC